MFENVRRLRSALRAREMKRIVARVSLDSPNSTVSRFDRVARRP
jgi:hypothetical protein